MKSKLLAVFLLAGSALFARPHFGVGIGGRRGSGITRPYYGGYYYSAPVVPPVVVAARSGLFRALRCAVCRAWSLRDYARPPYVGAVWVGPRWFGGRYYRGYWRR